MCCIEKIETGEAERLFGGLLVPWLYLSIFVAVSWWLVRFQS
jgi:hypothetical protein